MRSIISLWICLEKLSPHVNCDQSFFPPLHIITTTLHPASINAWQEVSLGTLIICFLLYIGWAERYNNQSMPSFHLLRNANMPTNQKRTV